MPGHAVEATGSPLGWIGLSGVVPRKCRSLGG